MMMSTSQNLLFSQYQSTYLEPYSQNIVFGFTGKPYSFGGLEVPENPSDEINYHQQVLHSQLCLNYKNSCKNWAYPKQVHGANIILVDDNFEDYCPEGDALIVTNNYQPIYIATADCVPIVMYSPTAHIGAVVHAGWRGTAQEIARKALLKLTQLGDVSPKDVIAVIGPAITLEHYQVSTEVAESLAKSVNYDISRLISENKIRQDDDNHFRVDLKAINALQLVQEGAQNIEISPWCTWEHNERFFSRRRGDPQNQIAYLMLV